MGKYRKKPIVIEAIQWFEHGDHLEVFPHPIEPKKGYINTLEGPLAVSKGDWIITGVQGEFYPCKSDIFELTYEEVE